MILFRESKFREHHLVLCLLVGAALLRVLPHPENLAPVGALALFAGAYLHNRLLWLVPLAALALGSAFNGQSDWLMLGTGSAGFLLISLLGRRLLALNDSNGRIAVAVPLAALACWFLLALATSLAAYPLNPTGLAQGLWNQLPQLTWHIIGDGGYALLLFGVFKLTRELPFVYYTPLR